MERYTREERVVIVKTHYKNGESYAETARKLRGFFGRGSAPNVSTIRRVVMKFEQTGSVMDSKPPVRRRTGRSVENIAAVHESIAQNPDTSIRRLSQQLQISRSTMQRILTEDLRLQPHKDQRTEQLNAADHAACDSTPESSQTSTGHKDRTV